MRLALALALALGLVTACGGTSTTSATSATDAVLIYSKAVAADDPKTAYGMLSESVRKNLSYKDFLAAWKQSSAERSLQAKALREQTKIRPDLGTRAIVGYRDGQKMSLAKLKRRWYLEGALITDTSQATPRDTIREFNAALADRDVDAVLRLLSKHRRETIGKQLDAFSQSLAAHAGQDIQAITDDRAVMTWEDDTGRYRIVLIRETGAWRVDEITIKPNEVHAGDEEPDDNSKRQ